MRPRRAGFLSLLMAIAQVSSSAATAPRQQDPKIALAAAAAAARNKDCKTTLDIVAKQMSASGFAGLSDRVRMYFYELGLACAVQRRLMDLALRYAQAGTNVSGAPARLWQARFFLAWQARHSADAVAAVESMAQANPRALNAMPVDTWHLVYRELKNKPKLRRRLLKVLASEAYVPDDVGSSTDDFRQEYAVVLAEAGDKAGTAAMVALIDDPKNLIEISVDPRLRDAVPADFDARLAVERHLTRMREIAAAHADMIQPALNVADDFLLLDKGEEALATLEAIHPEKAADAFSDRVRQLNWWWNSKARAYAVLGRYEDAVAAYSEGKNLAEFGQANISQTINLSELQLRFGHPADALATLAPIAAGKVPASTFGWMQFHRSHGCASFRIGKMDGARMDLAYVRKHAVDAPASLTSLQLCMGDIDGAAASIIKRLHMPGQRVQALLDLSDYAPPPTAYPKDPAEAGLAALKARADVTAAIARAGGTRRFNIPP